jgi:hypothetical protein
MAFIYGPDTTLASVAVLNMDDAGSIAASAAWCCAPSAGGCAKVRERYATQNRTSAGEAWPPGCGRAMPDLQQALRPGERAPRKVVRKPGHD